MGEFLFELLAELFGELLLTLSGRALEATLPGQWKSSPWLASLGYMFLGALGGGLSLFVWPERVIHAPPLRLLNFVGSPVLCGFAMYLLAGMRVRRGQAQLATQGARHGFLLGLSYQLVRLVATL